MRNDRALGGNTDTGLLKVLALLFMMVDHMGVVIFSGVPELRMIGRLALPLYAWCLVVGCERTRDIFKYALRLLLLAAISQPINMMALNNSWGKLNILFLLFLGVLAIAGIQKKRFGSQFWAPLLCYVALGFVNVDYGWKGLTFILLLYLSRGSLGGLCATYLAYALFWGSSSSTISSAFGVELTFLTWKGVGPVLSAFLKMQALVCFALPLIAIPTHSNLRMPKWLGYALYPMHLVVIIVIRLLMGVPLASMLSALGI